MQHLEDHIRRAMGDTAPAAFTVLEHASVMNVAGANTVALIRIPDDEPRIVFFERDASPIDVSVDARKVLQTIRDALPSRSLTDMIARLDNERNRTGIERVLRAQAAGEFDRKEAQERLGLRSMIDLVKLEREFGIPGTPRMVPIEEDMMHDFDAMDAEDRALNATGKLAPRQGHTVQSFRAKGMDDAMIRKLLDLPPDIVLPTAEEVEADGDETVYGIKPGDVRVGLDVAVTVGPSGVKIRVASTDGKLLKKVADRRHVGPNVGRYVTEEIERLDAAGLLPPVAKRW